MLRSQVIICHSYYCATNITHPLYWRELIISYKIIAPLHPLTGKNFGIIEDLTYREIFYTTVMVVATSGIEMSQSAHCNSHFLPVSQAFVSSCAIPELFIEAFDMFCCCGGISSCSEVYVSPQKTELQKIQNTFWYKWHTNFCSENMTSNYKKVFEFQICIKNTNYAYQQSQLENVKFWYNLSFISWDWECYY